jgi:hypothetical protein
MHTNVVCKRATRATPCVCIARASAAQSAPNGSVFLMHGAWRHRSAVARTKPAVMLCAPPAGMLRCLRKPTVCAAATAVGCAVCVCVAHSMSAACAHNPTGVDPSPEQWQVGVVSPPGPPSSRAPVCRCRGAQRACAPRANACRRTATASCTHMRTATAHPLCRRSAG